MPAFGNATDAVGTTSNSPSVSHTASVGSNTYAKATVVTGGTTGPKSVSGIDYGASAMTLVDSEVITASTRKTRVTIYELVNPPTGAQTVTATLTGSATNAEFAIAVETFTDIHQTIPKGTVAKASIPSGDATPSVDVTSAVGELVTDSIATISSGLTVGSGQTERWEADAGFSPYFAKGSTEAGAATVTMNWSTVGDDTVIVAYPLKPPAVVGGNPITMVI